MPAGGSAKPSSHETIDQRMHYVKQDGQAVFKFAVRKTEEIARRLLARNGLTANDIDLFVSHQANRRIIHSATEKLGVPQEKVIINIDRFGNTTAATIPLALNDARLPGTAEEGSARAAGVGRRRVYGRRCTVTLGVLELRIKNLEFGIWNAGHEFQLPNSRFRIFLITMSRIFILSPANCGGRRAKQAMSPNATFALAAALRSADGARLGDLFTFVSGLYFRGKLTYARRFARPPDPANPVVSAGIHIITPNAGLRSPDALVTHAAVRGFARGDIDADNRSYRAPLEASARTLLREVGPDCDVVLLGSVASPKYVRC